MKRLPLFLSVILITFGCDNIDENSLVYPLEDDVTTLDGIIDASYDVVSGEKGRPRDWERDQSLHHPNAIYSYKPRGTDEQITFSLSEFHADTDEVILQSGFYEKETQREVKLFGNMAHVWSSYETRESADGPVVQRGINSIQLYNDGSRWWIVSWVFDRETPLNPIIAKKGNVTEK